MSRKILTQKFAVTATLFAVAFLCLAACHIVMANGRNTKSRTFQQNERVISGKVIEDNQGIPGVNVLIKGTTRGTTTDAEGKYTLNVPNDAQALVFTFIGYQTQEVPIGNKAIIDVTLVPDVAMLGEVVVVGFGTQKKESVVGSMTTIKPTELKVPSSNLTTALAGRVAGVISYQRSGEPGQDNAQFFIRGVTTFGYKKDPLILIDGVEMTSDDLARLNVDDIASFSIMKDATATAVYGSRAANGIIYVTTKAGLPGKVKISARFESSISQPTQEVELADPITYMRLHNEAVRTRNALGDIPYSEDKIQKTMEGTNNPYVYPVTDWKKLLIKNYATSSRFNFNLSGGGDIANYYIAGTYTKDNGILKVDERNNFNNNIDLKKYNMRFNMDINLSKTTKATLRLQANFDDMTGPLEGGKAMYEKVMRTNPVLFPAYYAPDGANQFTDHILFGNNGTTNTFYINPYADMVKGYKDYSRALTLVQIEIRQKLDFITKGLSYRFLGNNNRFSEFDLLRYYNPYFYQIGTYNKDTDEYTLLNTNPTQGTEFLNYREGSKNIKNTFYMENAFNYDRTFGKHTLSGLAVLLMREQLEANPGDLQQSLAHRNIGLSSRITYSYNDRYFAEFNFGYNGSERFSKDKRYGFFPSAGVGWMISNENFFAPFKDKIDRLKLRGSYGMVGNDAIGDDTDRFFYLSNVNLNSSATSSTFGTLFNNNIAGVSTSRYENSTITWEKSYKSNLALELGLFNNMNIIAEVFHEHRTNILMTRADNATMGLQAPIRANVGEAAAKGADISWDYSKYFNDNFWVQGRANFTYATSKFLAYEEPDYVAYGTPWKSHVGVSLNQSYGLIAERLFVDGDSQLGTGEVGNSPVQSFGLVQGGDIKYKDINGDDKIDEFDKVPIGFPTSPEIVYGFGISAGFKKFDVNVFFQGLARESFWIDAINTAPFYKYNYASTATFSGFSGNNFQITTQQAQNQLLKAYADSHWSEENRDLYALWPRLSEQLVQNNYQQSTWFMRNGSFLRLKQVEIGYSPFSKDQLTKLHLTSVRFYTNGTNLLTFSKFKLWDPEMAGNGLGYPVQRVVNVGVLANF